MSQDAPLETRIELREGFIFVWQRGLATSMDEIRALQAEMEAALAKANTRFAVFDNRETQAPDELLRASMWTWLTEHLDRVALLQAEPKNIARAERTGARNRLSVRAFHDEPDAIAWLMSGVRGRSS